MIILDVIIQCDSCHNQTSFRLDDNSPIENQIIENLNLEEENEFGRVRPSTWIEKDNKHYCSKDCLQ